MRKLISQQQIDFAPGQNTFGLTVLMEKWDCGGGEIKTYWKYGLPDCVLVIPFTPDGKVILVDEFQPIVNKLPSFIGGAVEEDEISEQAAGRELLEETGYKAGKLDLLSTIAENAGRSNRKVFYYLATDCEKIAQPEHGISVVTLDPKEFWRRFYSGITANPTEVHDGPYTLQGAILAFAHLGLQLI